VSTVTIPEDDLAAFLDKPEKGRVIPVIGFADPEGTGHHEVT